MFFNVLDDIVKDYNNTIHSSIRMKPKDVQNKEDPDFKVGDYVRISKYKNIFSKGYTTNWSEEVFIISKVLNTVPWAYLINDLKEEEIKGSFYGKELQKTDQKEFRIEKIIKKRK